METQHKAQKTQNRGTTFRQKTVTVNGRQYNVNYACRLVREQAGLQGAVYFKSQAGYDEPAAFMHNGNIVALVSAKDSQIVLLGSGKQVRMHKNRAGSSSKRHSRRIDIKAIQAEVRALCDSQVDSCGEDKSVRNVRAFCEPEAEEGCVKSIYAMSMLDKINMLTVQNADGSIASTADEGITSLIDMNKLAQECEHAASLDRQFEKRSRQTEPSDEVRSALQDMSGSNAMASRTDSAIEQARKLRQYSRGDGNTAQDHLQSDPLPEQESKCEMAHVASISPEFEKMFAGIIREESDSALHMAEIRDEVAAIEAKLACHDNDGDGDDDVCKCSDDDSNIICKRTSRAPRAERTGRAYKPHNSPYGQNGTLQKNKPNRQDVRGLCLGQQALQNDTVQKNHRQSKRAFEPKDVLAHERKDAKSTAAEYADRCAAYVKANDMDNPDADYNAYPDSMNPSTDDLIEAVRGMETEHLVFLDSLGLYGIGGEIIGGVLVLRKAQPEPITC